jgi:uncharacterized membrane protein YkvA (DUF1232 family)
MIDPIQDEDFKAKEMNSEDAEKAKEKTIFTDDDRKLQFYEKLREKVRTFSKDKGGKYGVLSEYLFMLPDFFILISRLAMDDRVPAKKKIFAGAIIAYMLMPIDIIPDFIPVIGHLDDLVLVVLGLNMIFNDIDKQILIDNWSGEGNILELLQTISAKAEQFLDKNVYTKIKQWLAKKA